MCYSYILVFLVLDSTESDEIEDDGENQHKGIPQPSKDTWSDADLPTDKGFPEVEHLQDHGEDEDDEQPPSNGLAGFTFLEYHVP